jgi:hypothetical protein
MLRKFSTVKRHYGYVVEATRIPRRAGKYDYAATVVKLMYYPATWPSVEMRPPVLREQYARAKHKAELRAAREVEDWLRSRDHATG